MRRWTDLIASLLRHHYAIPFETIAQEVPGYAADAKPDSVKRTFERDKAELLRFGVPIESVNDDTGQPNLYTIRRKNFYMPYLYLAAEEGEAGPAHGKVDRDGYRALQGLTFEPDELAAVAAAAARVRELGDPTLATDATGAMRKLAFDLPMGAAAPVDTPYIVAPRARPDPAAFDVLGDALRDRKVVTFEYHAMGSDATTRREVEPYGLFYLNGHWYLAGCDREKQALRNFRLSRMGKVVANTKRPGTADYEIPPSFDLREHARSKHAWELGGGDATEAVVEFVRDTGAAAGAARLGAPVAGAPERRRFLVRRVDAFARWLLSFGGDARPVSPDELCAEYQGQLRRTLDMYAAEESAR